MPALLATRETTIGTEQIACTGADGRMGETAMEGHHRLPGSVAFADCWIPPDGGHDVAHERKRPDDPIAFIEDCVRRRQVLWTYHVNMRLANRFIPREFILAAADTYELVEAYPDDKYLPSYLVLAHHDADYFHVLFAVDVEGYNVRVVTAYRPDVAEWQENLKRRRSN